MENVKKDKIKVMQVLDTYFPNFDGPTILINNYAKCMKKRGDTDVEILVPKYPKYKDSDEFPVHRILSFPVAEKYRCVLPMFDRSGAKVLKNKKEPFDIIHVHSPFVIANHAINVARKNGIPSVITLHTRFHEDFGRILAWKPLRKFMMWYIMRAFKKADRVICVSDGTVDTIREYGYKGDVKVIRNGTDLRYPANAEELKEKVIKAHNLENAENVFLSVGRIVENKRLDLALDTMKILKDRGVKFTYLMVGAGSYEEKLKKHTTALGLDDCVIFTGKVMDRDLLSGYYLASDLFIFPSTFDTASLAPIEAAALKLPSIMTKGCSTAEIITDDRNGFVAENSAAAWANKIQEIIDKKHLLPEIKENAFNEVYRSWDSVVEELREYYLQVISECKEERMAKNAKKNKKTAR